MMRHALAALILATLAPAAAAQAYHPPRTPDGHPDFQGVWGTGFMTGLERPDGVTSLTVPPEQARAMAKDAISHIPAVVDPDANFGTDFPLAMVRGAYRTSLVIDPTDGKIPFTVASASVSARAEESDRHAFDNPEDRSTAERCIIGWGQAPMRPENGYTPVQIVQTRDAVVIMVEDVGGPRIIHMTGHPPPDALRTYDGWSAGHWEGDSLVVVTDHFRSDDPYRGTTGRALVAGPNSRVVERFTRLSDTELLEQFTIEDPTLYTRPWLAEFSLTRSAKPTYEYACHESNYALTNILVAARLGLQH